MNRTTGSDSRFPGRGAAAPMMLIAIIVRTFWGIAIEYDGAMNASWIVPIAALFLLLPLSFAARTAAGCTEVAPWVALTENIPTPVSFVLSILICLVLVFDCSINVRMMATTANVVALTDIPAFVLMLPIAAVIFYAVVRGTDGIGFAARIYLYIAAILMIVVIAVQWSDYRPGWLFPLLGGGIQTIAGNALVCAGWGALTVLTALISVPDRSRHVLMRVTIIGMGIAAGMLLTIRMLIPSMPAADLARSVKSEMLFSNGRVALSLQMLLVVLWDGSLLYLICVEAVTASCYLTAAKGNLPTWISGTAISVAALILANTAAQNEKLARGFDRRLFIGIGALLAALMTVKLFSERKKT